MPKKKSTTKRNLLDTEMTIKEKAGGPIGQRFSLLRAILKELGAWDEVFPMRADLFTPEYVKTPEAAQQVALDIIGEMLHRQKRVDHREHIKMLDLLSDLGFEVVHLNTGEGDVASRRVSIERKEDDLISSLFDDRRLRQLGAMREEAEFSFLIVTKSFEQVRRDAQKRGLSVRTLIGYVASLCAVGYPPLFIANKKEAATLMSRIVNKIEDDVPRIYVPRPKAPHASEYRDAIIQALPGIGLKTRRLLVEEFKTLAGLCTASPEDIAGVNGIGQATAERVFEILHVG
jgi:ERCC4-type nuclease